MALTSEELNFLVYRYLQESGECAAEVMDVARARGQDCRTLFLFSIMATPLEMGSPLFFFLLSSIRRFWRPPGSLVIPLGVIPRALRDKIIFVLSIRAAMCER